MKLIFPKIIKTSRSKRFLLTILIQVFRGIPFRLHSALINMFIHILIGVVRNLLITCPYHVSSLYLILAYLKVIFFLSLFILSFFYLSLRVLCYIHLNVHVSKEFKDDWYWSDLALTVGFLSWSPSKAKSRNEDE